MNKMKGVNSYCRELSAEDIRGKVHRGFVGGMWEEIGRLQFEFLVRSGLKPNHKLLDIGCGCLRGGIHYIKYLDVGHYHGIDINQSLIEAGKIEIQDAGLAFKMANLIVDDQFSIGRFCTKFDYMVSISVFTHLPMNIIIRCLTNVRENLAQGGVYFSTFFQAPFPAHLNKIKQNPGGIVTNYDCDPFHYSVEELSYMAKLASLELDVIGDWGHPRNQKMVAFRLLR